MHPIVREHHFYISSAKHIFLHVEKGIVFAGDAIRLNDAEKLGLKPLILYGLTVPGTQIEWITFSTLDNPRSLLGVLLEGWNTASGLRGYPDKLKINRHIAKACPNLKSSLADIGGISLEVADGKDKTFSASLRVAQHRVLEYGWRNRNGQTIRNIEQLNKHALDVHQEHINSRRWEWGPNNLVKERASKWIELPVNQSNVVLGFSKLDWTVGNWFSSWETNVPNNQKMRYWRDDQTSGCYWLVSGDNYDNEDADNINYDEEWDRRCAIKAKILIDCWPNPITDIATAIGTTAKQLQWFLSGQTELPNIQRDDLSEILGIEPSSEFVDYDVIGPCVLIAESPKKCETAYDELSNGGDLEYSFEVLPENGRPDPSWRYVVFAAFGSNPSILMFQRGSKTTDHLGDKLLINYQGERKVTANVYRDVVATCAECCTDPVLNRKLTNEFGKRHKHYFEKIGESGTVFPDF